MRDPIPPRVPKWPFFSGDALLLGAAYFIYARSELPMSSGQMALAALCVAAGALFGVVPFLLEYRVMARVVEAAGLTTVISQVQKLDDLAAEIRSATGQWQAVQEQADKTVAAAESIAQRMTTEVKSFAEFMQRVNDTEKANLRLEAEKLRRGEGEWLAILVRVLDHVYALHQAGLRSRQPSLVEQLTHFQNACLDAARRVGLAPFSPEPDEPFDTQRHQAADGDGKAPEGALVSQTLATGYTFQGRFLRPALVRLRGNEISPQSTADSPQSTVESPQSTTADSANGGDRQEPLPPEPAEPGPEGRKGEL
ncbi:MAG: nucleotide exchange factor GrpE [Verrucomicrobiota bacterium]|jgi:molecular chaperone GrpE (heat shock protein)